MPADGGASDVAGGALAANVLVALAAELFTAAMAASSSAGEEAAAMGSGTGFMALTAAPPDAPPLPEPCALPFLALRAASRKPARYILLSSSLCSSGKFDREGREMFETDSAPGLRGHATEVTLSGLTPGAGTPSTNAPPFSLLLSLRPALRSISSIPRAMSSSSSISSSMAPPPYDGLKGATDRSGRLPLHPLRADPVDAEWLKAVSIPPPPLPWTTDEVTEKAGEGPARCGCCRPPPPVITSDDGEAVPSWGLRESWLPSLLP
mmetsp:Transcript_18031/g.42064  ORF Transcript_18031/g.42064 Transcript_18031/m.42064 type:complete len:265 (+) Transcript_18031:1367-2161(+)